MNLFGLLARPVKIAKGWDPSTRIPPFVERLWMPAHAVCLYGASSQRPSSVWTSVDGWSGQFSLFERVGELARCDVEEDHFAASIDEARARDLARSGLFEIVLRRPGRIGKPAMFDAKETRLYHYPVWVCYRRRRAGLDLEVLDGYTGKRPGAKVRIAVLDALIAANKSRLDPERRDR
jgi:hypothetical protein